VLVFGEGFVWQQLKKVSLPLSGNILSLASNVGYVCISKNF